MLMLADSICRLKLKNIVFILMTLVSVYYIYSLLSSEINYPILIWWTPFIDADTTITCYDNYKCLLTSDKIKYKDSGTSKGFLFYGTNIDVQNLPVPVTGIWALFHEESPRNSAIFLFNRTYELFSITATFSRYSDFPLTLQYLENLSVITDLQYVISIKEKNKFLDSIAPVLYLQSDCDTPIERDAYVKELMKYIPVDSYGACLNNRNLPEEMSKVDAMDLYNNKLLHFIARYKFVVAFENAVCEDYITEKLWRPLQAGTVPIYMGSPSIKDWLPNVHSAILAQNFQSPEALASFLHRINKNDTIYETFLEHKHGKIANNFLKDKLKMGPYGIATDREHPIPAFECFVCESLHNGFKNYNRHHSVYDCVEPSGESDWKYYWKSGDCKSKALIKHVKHNQRLEIDRC